LTRKRLSALALGFILLTACRSNPAPATPAPSPTPTAAPTASASPTPAQNTQVRAAMLKGPTGLGAAQLMAQAEAGRTDQDYAFSVLADPAQAAAQLTSGETDIAALPTNLASTLYHKTGGQIQLLALNTLGTLYILETGESVDSLEDLAGKTLYAYGQGANPEYVLDELLRRRGLDPDEDLDIAWKSSTDEIAAAMASGDAQLCMLPVPAATTVLMQAQGARVAVDLTQEWDRSGAGGALTMGCVAVRTQFAQERPDAVEAFLEDYRASIAFMSDPDHLDEAAQLAETYAIVPKAAVAKAAIPDANLCFIDGEDMIADIQGYYQVLYAADPASIGGSIPDGAFYYGFGSE